MDTYRHSHEPTPAQLKAGNYPKRSLRFQGLSISIETEAGEVRRGVGPGGVPWERRMLYPYGYILGTLGMDGDHVDVYVGPDPEADFAYLIDQRVPPAFERVDEQKVMLGFASAGEACAVYLKHYDDSRFLGAVTAMPMDEFFDKVLTSQLTLIKGFAPATLDGEAVFIAKAYPHEMSGEPLLFKALEAGERWVTIHPNGPGTKGQPLLIKEHPDGTATVIGGAGGKLNHLKLRGVKAGGPGYRDELKQKAADHRAALKEQKKHDIAAGTWEAKQAHKKALAAQVKKARSEFVQSVAKLAGWKPEDMAFNDEAAAGLSEEAYKAAVRKHEAELFRRAKSEVDLNRKKLVLDPEARAAADLGTVPLKSADKLALIDLEPQPEVAMTTLGFSADYSNRSGLEPGAAKKEADAALGKQPDPDKVAAKKEKHEAIKAELEKFRETTPEALPAKPEILDDAVKAADLLRAQKKLRLLEKQAAEGRRSIDESLKPEAKAMVLEVSDDEVEAAVKDAIEQDVRTQGSRTFVTALEKGGGERLVAGYIGAGAFNSLNAAALGIGGDALIDRSVVDVLGIAGAAQVLARRLLADTTDKSFIKGIGAWHVANVDKLQDAAVKQAQALADAAAAIELPEAQDGFDLAAAQVANKKRRDAVAEAQRVLGYADGEMQAGAALVAALEGKPDTVEVNMSGTDPAAAVTQLRALGLVPGDYQLEDAGGALLVTVTAAGMDKLAKPVDVESLQQVQRNLAIINGEKDEDGWLPEGVARRPDLVMHVEPGVAERLSKPFAIGSDVAQGLKDYIGGRVADGDALVDILADVQSSDFFQKAGDPDAYRAALEAVAPLKGKDGKMQPVESLREAWEVLADDFIKSAYGGDRAPLHRQTFDVDQKSVDALHRALAQTPEGVAAFKPIGDLTTKERNGLRAWWYANVAHEDPDAAAKREAAEAHAANEPAKMSDDIFGGESVSPEWQEWQSKGAELSAAAKGSALDWPRYVEMLGSPAAAIEAVQDLVRSRVSSEFAKVYNTVNKDKPLAIGRQPIRHALDHLDAVDPKARAARAAKEAAVLDSLRERVGGKYAAGAVKDKLAAEKEKAAAFEQSQMGFFSTEEAPATNSDLGADERVTLGHAAEQKIAGMMSVMGDQFKPGQPTRIWSPSMSGGNNYARQRFIKLLEANGRVMGALGTGSGKSLLQLAGFTHLHAKGKAHRGIILAPSIAQGQFNGEALRYLEPGKFRVNAEPGASREERIKAYRDPGTHLVVATHQSFRDDMVYLGAKQAGITEKEMADRLLKMTPDKLAAWSKQVMADEGINVDYMSVDESQYTLNREGKENSRLAQVVDAFGENMPTYAPMSGDPIKNDPSEAFDLLAKMDRKRYSDRGAFMRRYGGDTLAAKEGLQRELARYVYASRIDPDVKADRKVLTVPLNDEQRKAIAAVDMDVSNARIAHMSGGVAVEEMKRLSPESFVGVPDKQHGEIAKAIQKNAGLLKNAAIRRVINNAPTGAKLDKVSELAAERKGKPGVVFCHNLEMVEHIRARLEKEGHRVVTITGGDSSTDKDKKRLAFNPEKGDASADILIASDAGATGMNLQRGVWQVQVDTPDTAMIWQQRKGRIFRTGQKNDVELIDLVSDHPSEEKARDRLRKKNDLRELMTSPMNGLDDTGLAGFLHQAKISEQEGGTA